MMIDNGADGAMLLDRLPVTLISNVNTSDSLENWRLDWSIDCVAID